MTHAMPYHLLDANGDTVTTDTPGLLGGNRRLKIYGRLDCPSALHRYGDSRGVVMAMGAAPALVRRHLPYQLIM